MIFICIYGVYIYGKTSVYQKKYNTLALSRYGPHIGAHGCTSPVHQAKNKKKIGRCYPESLPRGPADEYLQIYMYICAVPFS